MIDFDDFYRLLSHSKHDSLLTDEKSDEDISVHTRSSSSSSALRMEADSSGDFETNTSDDDIIYFDESDGGFEENSGESSERSSLPALSQLTCEQHYMNSQMLLKEELDQSMANSQHMIYHEGVSDVEYDHGDILLSDSEYMDCTSVSGDISLLY